MPPTQVLNKSNGSQAGPGVVLVVLCNNNRLESPDITANIKQIVNNTVFMVCFGCVWMCLDEFG